MSPCGRSKGLRWVKFTQEHARSWLMMTKAAPRALQLSPQAIGNGLDVQVIGRLHPAASIPAASAINRAKRRPPTFAPACRGSLQTCGIKLAAPQPARSTRYMLRRASRRCRREVAQCGRTPINQGPAPCSRPETPGPDNHGRPGSASTRPAMTFIKVDLPDPLRPGREPDPVTRLHHKRQIFKHRIAAKCQAISH